MAATAFRRSPVVRSGGASALVLAGIAALSAAAVAATPQPPGQFRAGAAKVDITPTDLAGLDPMGYGAFKVIHDHIHARALVLENGPDTIALVALDAIETGDTSALRERIHREVGIASENVLIFASHSHSAPRRGQPTPGALTKFGTPQTDAFTLTLDNKIVAALKQAKASLKPARMGSATGRVDVNVSRDQYTPTGWGLGYNPAGPSDKTVRLLKWETLSGEPIAVLFNYGVHPTAALEEHQLGGDLSGVAERYVEDSLGGNAVALFTQGAGGDQRARYPEGIVAGPAATGEIRRISAFPAMEAQGTMLGAEVVRLAQAAPGAIVDARLKTVGRVFTCPVRPGAKALRTFQTGGASPEQITAVPIRLSVVMIGEIALGAVGGEVVTNIAENLYRSSPVRETWLVTLANDRTGYFVDDATYDTNNFEVQATPAARGCAEQGIVGGLTDIIRQIRP